MDKLSQSTKNTILLLAAIFILPFSMIVLSEADHPASMLEDLLPIAIVMLACIAIVLLQRYGSKTAIEFLVLVLVLAVGAHLYEYGASIPLIAPPLEIQAIRVKFEHDVLALQQSGQRRPGTGVVNGMANNFETWFTDYKGCSKQADRVASDLQIAFPDWKITVVHSTLHHWVIASKGATALRIDPWTGEVTELVK